MSWEQCTGGVKATRLLLLISLFSTHVKGGDVLFDGGCGYCFPSDTTPEKEFFRCCLLCCRCIAPLPLKCSSHTNTHLMLRNTGPNSHAACTFLAITTVQRQVLTQLRLVLTPPEFLLVSYCGAKVGRLTRKFVKNRIIYGSCSIREKYFIYTYSIMFTDIT